MQTVLEQLGITDQAVLNLSQQVGGVGSWVYLCDTGEYWWSDEVYRIYNVKKGEPLTRELFVAHIHPDDYRTAADAWRKALAGEAYHVIHRIVAGGVTRWLEQQGEAFVQPDTDRRFLLGMVHDITKVREERTRAELDLDTIFNESLDFLSIIGPDNHFQRINPAFLSKLGYSRRELNERSLIDLIHPEDKEYALFALDKIRTVGGVRGFCNRCICKNGNILYLEVNAKLADSGSNIIASARDTTNQREIEARNAELERSFELERLKSEFFANISHEFKTPINIILSSLQLLTMKLERCGGELNEVDYARFCNYIEQNSYKLLRLTTNLIDSTKLDSGYLELCPESCDFRELVETSVSSAEIYAASHGITLAVASQMRENGRICCDKGKIDRILLNLLSNAIKNTPAGGRIDVLLTEDDEYAAVEVRDNGAGLDEALLPHIFEKFCVARVGLVKNTDGGGIGLSIVKSLVELHGGQVSVKSKLGVGSAFRFTLSKTLSEGQPLTEALGQSTHQTRAQIELSDLLKQFDQ